LASGGWLVGRAAAASDETFDGVGVDGAGGLGVGEGEGEGEAFGGEGECGGRGSGEEWGEEFAGLGFGDAELSAAVVVDEEAGEWGGGGVECGGGLVGSGLLVGLSCVEQSESESGAEGELVWELGVVEGGGGVGPGASVSECVGDDEACGASEAGGRGVGVGGGAGESGVVTECGECGAGGVFGDVVAVGEEGGDGEGGGAFGFAPGGNGADAFERFEGAADGGAGFGVGIDGCLVGWGLGGGGEEFGAGAGEGKDDGSDEDRVVEGGSGVVVVEEAAFFGGVESAFELAFCVLCEGDGAAGLGEDEAALVVGWEAEGEAEDGGRGPVDGEPAHGVVGGGGELRRIDEDGGELGEGAIEGGVVERDGDACVCDGRGWRVGLGVERACEEEGEEGCCDGAAPVGSGERGSMWDGSGAGGQWLWGRGVHVVTIRGRGGAVWWGNRCERSVRRVGVMWAQRNAALRCWRRGGLVIGGGRCGDATREASG